MNSLILIAVVGVLGSFVLCWVTRTVVVCASELVLSTSDQLRVMICAASDGELAAMIARNQQGVLGGEAAAHSAHERLAKAERYSGGRSYRYV